MVCGGQLEMNSYSSLKQDKPSQRTVEKQFTEMEQEVNMEQEDAGPVQVQATEVHGRQVHIVPLSQLLPSYAPLQLTEDHGQQPSQHRDYLQVQVSIKFEYKSTAYLFAGPAYSSHRNGSSSNLQQELGSNRV